MEPAIDEALRVLLERLLGRGASDVEMQVASAMLVHQVRLVLSQVLDDSPPATETHRENDALRRETDHLRRAMESRATIEQAKGVVMASIGCAPDEAFEVLNQQSQNTNRKLRDIADEIVAQQRRPQRRLAPRARSAT